MVDRAPAPQVLLTPWADGDLDLLMRINTPQMKQHVGGPETHEQLLARHRRYLEIGSSGKGSMFGIVLPPTRQAVGTVGYWERRWQNERVYETGWNVLPPFQGRGVATAAVAAAVADAASRRANRFVHAFPSVGNPASNAVCRRAGFSLLGACDFEYPPGHVMRSHDWCLDLLPAE